MAPLVLKQLAILLWKSWIMRRQHWISSIFELLFPIFFTAIIVGAYSGATKGLKVPDQKSDDGWEAPTYFKPKTYQMDDLFGQAGQYGNRYDIYYAPNNTYTQELMSIFYQTFIYPHNSSNVKIWGFESESQLFDAMVAKGDYYNNFGLVFESNGQNENDFRFKIRQSTYRDNCLNLLFPQKSFPGPVDADNGVGRSTECTSKQLYEDYGFSTLQIAMNEVYMTYLSQHKSVKKPVVSEVATQRYPYPRYLKTTAGDGFSLIPMAGMMLITGYIVMCPLIVKRITDEKVAKAKEMLRMMGLSDWVFWGSHFINFFTVMIVQSLINTTFLIYGFGGLPVFMWSNFFIVFIALILFNINSILSSMLLTTVFNRPVIAVVVSVVLFEASHTVPMALLDPMYKPTIDLLATNPGRILSCMLPNAGMNWVFTTIGQVEIYQYGVTWSNLWHEVPGYGRFTVGYVMLMQFISIFFYGLLIWYVDNVWPFQFGIPKPVWFPFLPSYWFPNRRDESQALPLDEKSNINPNHFEREPQSSKVGIRCENLRKVFSSKVAVNDVSLNIFSGQITILLGHNGAGKTTTMNMITGIFPPSAGTALIDGYDIREQTKKARKSMALCPQENIVYNELTVWQHLKLYAILKDHPWSDVNQEVNRILQMVSLVEKRNALSSQLSGGMKRKLCLGIAMIANSEILILDEPTSGMDPEARRHIWDVLQSIRAQRTILLTTHYMEEADALGDRIAIMSEGMVKCCGTPMFLKKAFGAGYHLRISKGDHFDSEKVLQLIRQFMPSANRKSEIHSEIIYSLESGETSSATQQNASALLGQMFGQLETRKAELNIHSCGLSVTTMEDVFLRVGNDFESNVEIEKNRNGGSDQNRVFQTIPRSSGTALSVQQFRAMIIKRFHYARRYWPMIILQSILPAILFMCILLLDYSLKKTLRPTDISLEQTLNAYGKTEGFVKSMDSQFTPFYKETVVRDGVSAIDITENPNVWALSHGNSIPNYIKTYLSGARLNTSGADIRLEPWYNNEAIHTLPAAINLMYESLLAQMFPNERPTISVSFHPIPSQRMSQIDTVTITVIVICLLLVPLTVPFIGASYVLFPVHERVSNSKLLQLMNGMSSAIFWSASFLWDLLNHLLATIFIFIVFAIFDWNKVFMDTNSNRTGLFFMIFLFGFSSIPLAYLVSLRLKKASSGYALLVVVYLVTGLVLVMAMGILQLTGIVKKETMEWVLFIPRVLPVFSMSYGIQKLYKIGSYRLACSQTLPAYLAKSCTEEYLEEDDPLWGCCPNKCKQNNGCYDDMNALRFDNYGVGVEFMFLLFSGFLFLLILWLIEGNFERILYFFEKRSKSAQTMENQLILDMNTGQWVQQMRAQEDSDVAKERQRVTDLLNRNDYSSEALLVKDLTKTFGKLIPVPAVQRLTFGVHKEECFGLLGVNGAGKTTFRMLTGDETLSDGNAFISGIQMRQELKTFQKQIGYCPQFDALLDKLTGRETLYMFCRLRGMAEEMIGEYVTDLVQMCDLQKHVDKCTETYSGGNKRKLSLAIALCAAPPVIFLDEPTSGVDPQARRKIWSTLSYLQERYGSAFILTSHSMEECEALCARLAIMVNGQLQCFGSVQHLRSKFGQGFTIVCKLKRELSEESGYLSALGQELTTRLPSAVLKDSHQCLLHYHVTDTCERWSRMFVEMEEVKRKFQLEDYVISDTSLEQIFLSFARRQR